MTGPRDACGPLPTPPSLNIDTPFVLLATEGGCGLGTKIINAQEANYRSIVIIMNTKHPKILHVHGDNKSEYKINVSFIGAAAGKKLEGFVYNPTSNAR